MNKYEPLKRFSNMSQQPLFRTNEMTSKTFVEMNKEIQKKKKKQGKKEEKLQLSLSKYARTKYPDLIFQVDIASGMKLSLGQAVKAKQMRSSRSHPDFIVMESRGGYNSLCIELKNQISDVYLKDGVTISNVKSNQHVLEQAEMLKRLRDKGFWADFGFSLNGCIKILDDYMALPIK